MVDKLVNNNHLEDGPKLDKLECKRLIKHISEKNRQNTFINR